MMFDFNTLDDFFALWQYLRSDLLDKLLYFRPGLEEDSE